jgi:kinesin family protein 6/9
MMRVSNEATINIELDPLQLIERYKKEARDLRQELAMHDTLANRSRVVYEPYTPEQQYQMQLIAEKYLDGSMDEVEIESLRQIKEILTQMKNIYRKNVARYSSGAEKGKTRPPTSKTGPLKPDLKNQEEKEDGVGQEEHSGGFGLGRANPHSRPIDSSALEPKSQFRQEEDDLALEKKKSLISVNSEEKKISSARSHKREGLPDKNQGFLEFKQAEGRDLENSLNDLKEELKQKSGFLKMITNEVNSIKKEIDLTKEVIDNARRHRATEEEDIIDEEEFVYIKKMRDLKKQYRLNFDSIKSAKDEVSNLNRNIEFLREKMISEFERWYENKYGYIPLVSREEPRPGNRHQEEKSNEDLDQDAVAYIKAKQNVQTLHKAKKTLGAIGKA